MSKKIAVMCGHGTQTNGVWDNGCSYAGYTEAKLMLPITKAAVKYLRARGVTVISDADTNNNKNMIVDVAWANREKVQAYVSIHCDYSKAPSGVMPLYVSSGGKKLATVLNKVISKGMPMKSRGVVRRTDLYELNATDAYACILETGAIKADLKTLKDAQRYGELIGKALCEYLGVKTTVVSAPKEVLYRVRKSWNEPKTQVGAYKSLDNAKVECNKHPGFSVYEDNGKVVYTNKPAAKATPSVTTTPAKATTPAKPKAPVVKKATKADTLVSLANKFCWPLGTSEKKWAYKTGTALAAYKSALKKYMHKSAKISQSDCGYFVSVCVRAAGLSSSFNCLNWSAALPSTLKFASKGKKLSSAVLKPGDIIRYKKTSGSQHALMYLGNGKIAEAGRKIRFPVIRKDTQKYNAKNVRHSTLQVIRAK